MNTLSNSELTLRVSPHGAELTSIVRNGHEYLWQADPAYWKRHSPVLFPIVGSVWQGEYRVDGQVYPLSQHGFARDMDFELIQESADELRYRLTDTEETRKKYPFPFVLEIGYRLRGQCIDVLWQVTNPASTDLYFQIGAHPAFYFPNYSPSDPCRGFFGFDRTEGLSYIRIAEKGCVDPDTHYPLELTDGLLPLDTHTFDIDTFILEDGQVRKVTLYDNDRHAILALHFDAPVLGLWSPPGKDAPFVCIEPWYGRCDRAHYAGEYKERDWVQHLAPGGVFRGGYTIEIMG